MCVGENTMLQLKTQVSSLNHNGFRFMCHRKGPARFLWVHIPRFISKDGFVGNVYMYIIVCMYNIEKVLSGTGRAPAAMSVGLH